MNTAATDVWLNSGPGQRLDGRTPSTGNQRTGAQNGPDSATGDISSEDMQIAMAISASMGGGGGDSVGAGGGSGGGGAAGSGGGGGDDDEEDDVARAIALSLSQEESRSSSASASTTIYTPQPVPELQPKGPDVVRVQVRSTKKNASFT